MRWFWSEIPQPQELPYNPDDEPPPLEDVVQRGAAAHRLLNDPTLAEAFRLMREDIYAQWFATKLEDATRREQLYYQAHALAQVTTKLITYRGIAQVRAAGRAA
jgi:hypothetical protein